MNREEGNSKKGIYSACNTRTVGLFMAALITLCIFTHAASAAQISVEPSFQTVSNGENFTVDIYVDPEGSTTAGVGYVLYFNNTLLNAISLVSGTFFSGFTTNTYGEGINNSTGTIDYGETIQGSGGVTTPGTLTTITFQAIAGDGTSELCFDEIWTELSDPDGHLITTNISDGSVKIGLCGDVDGDGDITMGDVGLLWPHVFFPEDFPLASEWAGDVDGDGDITMGDVGLLWPHVFFPEDFPLNCK